MRFRGYQIPALEGRGYFCPGMGFARVIGTGKINFEGHSSHYALGINIPHLAQVAILEREWNLFYNNQPLDSFG